MVSLCPGYVTYLFLTRSPLYAQSKSSVPFDLHVLATPPAFVLSQDQTLRFNSLKHETPSGAPCVLRIDLTHLDQKNRNASDSNVRLQTRMFENPPTGQADRRIHHSAQPRGETQPVGDGQKFFRHAACLQAHPRTPHSRGDLCSLVKEHRPAAGAVRSRRAAGIIRPATASSVY